MTDFELAQLHKTTDRTIRRWKAKGAPLDKPEDMPGWIEKQKSRRGVNKFVTKAEADAPIAERPAATMAETIPLDAAVTLDDAPDDDLGRARRIEKVAARLAESGDAKAIDAWAKASAEARRLEEQARKTASSITEGDRISAEVTLYVLTRFQEGLEKLPDYAAIVSVGCRQEDAGPVIEKVQEYIDGMFSLLLEDLILATRGTALASLFPLPEDVEQDWKRHDREHPNLLKRPPNERQADTCLPGGE
jgi:hypothetical protein